MTYPVGANVDTIAPPLTMREQWRVASIVTEQMQLGRVNRLYRPFPWALHWALDVLSGGLWVPFHYLSWRLSGHCRTKRRVDDEATAYVLRERLTHRWQGSGPCVVCGCSPQAHKGNVHHPYAPAHV